MKTLSASIPSSVTIVAVTKTFPFSVVNEAYRAGFRHFGENRVEEAMGKIMEARKKGLTDIVWHMIGHVQSRKVGDIVDFFDRVDSVDTLELLDKLNAQVEKQEKNIPMLLEVNLSGEATKSGFDLVRWTSDMKKFDRFLADISSAQKLSHVRLHGLMTMAPYVTRAEDNRLIFRSMRSLSEAIRTQIPDFGAELSMGTSCDYPVAVEEGATQIRIGEALFGKRQHPSR